MCRNVLVLYSLCAILQRTDKTKSLRSDDTALHLPSYPSSIALPPGIRNTEILGQDMVRRYVFKQSFGSIVWHSLLTNSRNGESGVYETPSQVTDPSAVMSILKTVVILSSLR